MDTDYEKLGLKCGIEIHQQLDTHKLFCQCPSKVREDPPDMTVVRRMRAVAGELGDFDPAALHEFLRNRALVYEAYSDSNCLVELDEEPPHPLNGEALEIAIKVSLLLNAKIIDEFQVMRKTVIDGSNTSGFQRTVLVAMDGFVETSRGRVGIPAICLEEDAARKIREDGNRIVYRLDRLGIPLIEIGTSPDIKNPGHAREVAEKLGMILRATNRVKRGLGTIRQDLNVSITGGERIEVKGVQDLRLIPKYVENEVRRQTGLIELKKELLKRGVKQSYDKGISPPLDITAIFSGDARAWIRKLIASGNKIWGMRLPGFAGLLGRELMPDHRFGTELAHVARVTSGVGGILHSDEKANCNVLVDVSGKLECGHQDAWVAIVGEGPVALTGFEAIHTRCRAAFNGVPKETRRATPEGTTEYMRPLPGSARMYPETDEPPILPESVEEMVKSLPELPDDSIKRLESLGLGRELSTQLVRDRKLELFSRLAGMFPSVKGSVIATTLVLTPKEIKKRHKVNIGNLMDEHFVEVLSRVNDGSITKDVIPEILVELAGKPGMKVDDVIEKNNLRLLSEKEIERIVRRIVDENRDLAEKSGKKAADVLLGRVMAETKGKASPQLIKRLLDNIMT